MGFMPSSSQAKSGDKVTTDAVFGATMAELLSKGGDFWEKASKSIKDRSSSLVIQE